jgi:glycosyltransferase involved in cell wall biosynthesis
MTEHRPTVAFIINGGPDSAMAERARAFATRLADRFDGRVIFRTGGKLTAAARMFRQLIALRPDACYVLDVAASGVAAAGLYKHVSGTPFVLDTGDAVVELARALGRGRVATAATSGLEAYALRFAGAVVVRGRYHQQLLARRGVCAEFIPDGVDVDAFTPPDDAPANDPTRPLTIGVLGNSIWVPARQTCYGWELVELIRLLRGQLLRPVRGVLIGGGNGVEILRRRCAQYGLSEFVEFTGHVPHAELPARLRMIDICLSTQTNDVIGQVRTTGKLPLYLAAGRFVLASNVGEAARVLPPEMLVDFEGESDPAYPAKLAARVTELLATRAHFGHQPACVKLASEHFDYHLLTPRVSAILSALVGGKRRAQEPERQALPCRAE